jgi:competence protein ComEA
LTAQLFATNSGNRALQCSAPNTLSSLPGNAVVEQAKATQPVFPIAQPVITEPTLLATWPRCVQVAVAVLLALGIGYLLGRSVTADPAFRGSHDHADIVEREVPRLDLNRASRGELALLRGLGPARAQAIEDHRRQHGPFRSVDELRKVPGVGPKTLDRIRSMLFVDDAVAMDAESMTATEAVVARPAPASVAKSKKEASLANPINVNRADAAGLQKLPGVGVKTAQRILDERTLRGPFKTVDELRRVPGIGPKTLEKLRPYVVVDAPVSVAGS